MKVISRGWPSLFVFKQDRLRFANSHHQFNKKTSIDPPYESAKPTNPTQVKDMKDHIGLV